MSTLWPGDVVVCPLCGRLDPEGAEVPPHLCGACLQSRPAWDRARAAYGYGGLLQEQISRWKNLPEPSLGRDLGALMARALPSLGWVGLPDETLVVPMPAHRVRLRDRGFYPAGQLAQAVARAQRWELARDALCWTKPVPSSRGKTRSARLRRLSGVIQPQGLSLRGRTVLLVDDVMTTGATARAASRACRRGGADFVHVATLARALG